MSNVEKMLTRDDVKKLAKKEAKLLIAPLQKTVVALKQRIIELEKLVKGEEKVQEEEKIRAAAERSTKVVRKPMFHGKKITKLRKRLHLTQAEFAELLGVNMFSVSHWELGKNVPRAAQQAKILELRELSRPELRKRLNTVRTVLDAKADEKKEKAAKND